MIEKTSLSTKVNVDTGDIEGQSQLSLGRTRTQIIRIKPTSYDRSVHYKDCAKTPEGREKRRMNHST